jgi:hypothetical protein
MKADFVVSNNAIEVNKVNIAMLELYIAPVNHSTSNDKLSTVKLKAEAFLGYLSKRTCVDSDFTDETSSSWSRNVRRY